MPVTAREMAAIVALLAGAVLPACSLSTGGGGGSSSSTSSPSVPIVAATIPAEAPPVGPFVNDAGTTQLLLDKEVGLDKDAAREIVAARDGIGQTPTAIVDASDLEPISEVGPVTVERVERFSANWAPFDQDPLLAFLNDPGTTFDVLHDVVSAGGVRIPSATAQAIFDHRASGDRFDSRSELDAVTSVGVARLQDVEAKAGLGRTLAVDSETQDDLRAVAFAKDGTLALVVGRSEAGAAAWVYDPLEEESFEGDVAGEDEASPGFTLRRMDLGVLGPLDLHDVAFAPDGRSAIAVGEGGKALRFDRETRTWTDISPPRTLGAGVLVSVAFAPDGEAALAADGESWDLYRLELARRRWSVIVGVRAAAVAFSAAAPVASAEDGGVAIAASESGRLVAVDGSRTTPIETNVAPGFQGFGVDASTGDVLAVGASGLAFFVRWSAGTLAGRTVAVAGLERVATRSVRDLYGAAVAPSGAYALIVGDRGEVLRHDAARGATSRLTLRRVSDPDEVENRALRDVAFAPDGSYAILVGDGGALFRHDPAP